MFMTLNTPITIDMLIEKDAYSDLIDWYQRTYTSVLDYGELLVELVHDVRYDDAIWVLQQFGKVNEVLKLDGSEIFDNFIYPGNVYITGDVVTSVGNDGIYCKVCQKNFMP